MLKISSSLFFRLSSSSITSLSRKRPVTRASFSSVATNNPGASSMVSTITSTLNKSSTVGNTQPKMKLKEKMRIFWTSLYIDYRDVMLDAVGEGRAKPGKAVFYLVSLGGIFYAMFNNPGKKHYFDSVTKMDTELSLIAKDVRNPISVSYLQNVRQMEIKGLLRHTNCAFFSIVWRDHENPEAAVFHAKCKYVKPRWSEILSERLVDVGFVGRWWILSRKMVDFDVNPTEWEDKEKEDGWSFASFFSPPVVKAFTPS